MSEPLQNQNPCANTKRKFEELQNNASSSNPPPPPPVPDGVVAATEPGSNVDVAVGQNFIGVIDGIFSGGYLLSIKIGNSNGPILKGVAFNPESQVSAEIDRGEEEEEEEYAVEEEESPFEK